MERNITYMRDTVSCKIWLPICTSRALRDPNLGGYEIQKVDLFEYSKLRGTKIKKWTFLYQCGQKVRKLLMKIRRFWLYKALFTQFPAYGVQKFSQNDL